MNLVVVVCVAIVLLDLGMIGSLLTFYPTFYKNYKRKWIHFFCCLALWVLGIVVIITMMKTPVESIKTEYNSYAIEKITTFSVTYISEDECYTIQFANNNNCTIEKATNEYENAVLKKSEHQVRHWLVDLNYTSVKYIIYLDEEAYARYKNNTVIYERKEE